MRKSIVLFLVFQSHAFGEDGEVGSYHYLADRNQYEARPFSVPVRVEAHLAEVGINFVDTETSDLFLTPQGGDTIVMTDSEGNRDCVDQGQIFPGGQWNGGGCGRLVGHYPLLGDANDVSGYENHGTVYGALPGKDGYWFDGKDDYIDLGDPPQFQMVDQFTVSAWVKVASRSRYMGIVGKMYFSNQPDGMHGWMMYRGQTGGVLPPAQFRFTIGDGAWPPRFTETPFSWFDTDWRFVCAVKDGLESRIYVDGVQIGGQNLPKETVSPRGGPISIGKQYSYHQDTGAYGWFYGVISKVKIWSYVLSDEEIAAEYTLE